MRKKSISFVVVLMMLLGLCLPMNALADTAIKVQMFNGTTASSTNTLSPKFKIVNTGTSAVNLSDVKVRYYFTIDGDKQQGFWCDHAAITGNTYADVTKNVTGSFVKLSTAVTGADYYLEIGFSSGSGTLATGGTVEIQTRFSKNDWTNYNQADDYSFNSTATSYVDWTKVGGYVAGTLVYGTDPANSTQPTDSKISPTSATFDKNTANQADITVNLTLNGNTLSAIKNDSTTLVSGTDYTVSGTTVTLKKSYLATLAVGTASLTFDFSAGTDPVLALTVKDTTSTTESFTLGVGTSSAKVGSTVTIPVKLSNIPTNGICCGDFKLSYDTSVLTATAVAAGDIVSNSSVNFASSIDSTTGTISFLFLDETLGSQLITKDGVFANITFTVKSTATASTSAVKVKSIGAFADKSLTKVETKSTDGAVTITAN